MYGQPRYPLVQTPGSKIPTLEHRTQSSGPADAAFELPTWVGSRTRLTTLISSGEGEHNPILTPVSAQPIEGQSPQQWFEPYMSSTPHPPTHSAHGDSTEAKFQRRTPNRSFITPVAELLSNQSVIGQPMSAVTGIQTSFQGPYPSFEQP